MTFDSRQQAGQLLGEELKYQGIKAEVVFGLVRGGLPIAAEVAQSLKVPLKPLVVKKIGVLGNPELAVGTAAKVPGQDKIVAWWNESTISYLGLTEDWKQAQLDQKKEEIEDYLHQLSDVGLSDEYQERYCSVVVADDGAATGATMQAAVKAIKDTNPTAEIIVALPVASTEAAGELRRVADEVVILHEDRWLGAVGQFYRQFDQVSWEEVRELLKSGKR